MNCTYRKPKWVHVYQRDDEYALFNAKNLHTLYCDAEALQLLNTYHETRDAQNQEQQEIIQVFKEKEFLIDGSISEQEEEQLLNHSRQKILDHKTDVTGHFGRIRAIRLVLTEKCNMQCGYCFVQEDTKGVENDMSREVMLKALDLVIQMNKGKDIEIHFFGGEPLLKFDLIKEGVFYVNQFVESGELSGAEYAITTNGTLITPEISQFFKEHNFEVSVSVDGWREINDMYRMDRAGRGTFDKVMQAIEILQKDRNRIGLLLSPYTHNIDKISEIWEYFIKEWGCTGMAINSPQPGMKGWEISGKKLAHELYKCKKITEKYHAVFESLGDRVSNALDTRVPQILACNTFSNTTGILVSPEGLVSPCIVNWTVKEVLQHIDKFTITPEFHDWKNYQIDLRHQCMDCPALNICGGVCALEGYYVKKTGKRDVERCAFFQEYLRLAIWD